MTLATVKVKITARNFTFLDKVYGTNGEYTVNPDIARWMVREGKGKVIEGFLPDEEEADLAINDKQFLKMVERNADRMLEIIEAEYKRRRDVDETPETGFENVSMSADLSVTKAEDAVGSSDGEASSAETSASSESESTTAINASDDGSGLPQDFPGREVLDTAGIKSLTQIPSDKDQLMAINGMTDKLAKQIGVKLSQGK